MKTDDLTIISKRFEDLVYSKIYEETLNVVNKSVKMQNLVKIIEKIEGDNSLRNLAKFNEATVALSCVISNSLTDYLIDNYTIYNLSQTLEDTSKLKRLIIEELIDCKISEF